MSQLRVRSLDAGELDGAEELMDELEGGDAARASLARLGGIEEKSMALGDGWAASVEVDGTSLLVRGEPPGAAACWAILAQPGTDGGEHAAKRLQALVVEESTR